MSPENMDYLKLAAAVLGGGACGAIITATVAFYRNRIQPVRYQMKTVPIFAKAPKTSAFETVVTLKEQGTEFAFENLHFTELKLENAGNQDIKEFTVGLTAGASDQIVDVNCESPDRHHIATKLMTVSPAEPKQAVDFKLTPFNRRDNYSFRILSFCQGDGRPSEIQLSSSEPVKFVAATELTVAIGNTAGGLAIEIIRSALAIRSPSA